MKTIPISDSEELQVIKRDEEITLLFRSNGEDLVCRTCHPRKLQPFLDGEEEAIFKGNLTLHHEGKFILIEVKNQKISRLETNALRVAVECVKGESI